MKDNQASKHTAEMMSKTVSKQSHDVDIQIESPLRELLLLVFSPRGTLILLTFDRPNQALHEYIHKAKVSIP